MTKENLVDQMITQAAEEAKIDKEQSRICLIAALHFMQEMTQIHGYMDLSEIGAPGTYTRVASKNLM